MTFSGTYSSDSVICTLVSFLMCSREPEMTKTGNNIFVWQIRQERRKRRGTSDCSSWGTYDIFVWMLKRQDHAQTYRSWCYSSMLKTWRIIISWTDFVIFYYWDDIDDDLAMEVRPPWSYYCDQYKWSSSLLPSNREDIHTTRNYVIEVSLIRSSR